MRAFIAITPPDATLDQLEQLQHHLPVGRVVPRENLHLTLSFLDDQDGEALEIIHDVLSGLHVPAFEVGGQGVNTLGDRAPNLVFAAIEPAPPLMALEQKIRGGLARASIAVARKRFRPHITIARLPRRLEQGDLARLQTFLGQHAGFSMTPFNANSFSLFQSDLHPAGAIYTELVRYDLAPLPLGP